MLLLLSPVNLPATILPAIGQLAAVVVVVTGSPDTALNLRAGAGITAGVGAKAEILLRAERAPDLNRTANAPIGPRRTSRQDRPVVDRLADSSRKGPVETEEDVNILTLWPSLERVEASLGKPLRLLHAAAKEKAAGLVLT